MGRIEGARRFVVVDGNVEKHYSAALRDYFSYHHVDVRIVAFPGGEENKTIDYYQSIVRELELLLNLSPRRTDHRHRRRCTDRCGWIRG